MTVAEASKRRLGLGARLDIPRRRTRLLGPALLLVLVGITVFGVALIVRSADGSAPQGASSTRVVTPPRSTVGGKGVQLAVSVSDLNAANAVLPFKAVFPSGVTPTGIQVPISGRPSDPKGFVTAHFDTATVGSYMLSEWTSDGDPTAIQRGLQRPVTSLQEWVAETCTDCTPQVVTEDGVPVEVLASPVIGLHLYWVRGDGTSSPVATEIDWSTDMPPNNVIPSQQAALAIADDIISQGG